MYKQKYVTYKKKYTNSNQINNQLNNELYTLLSQYDVKLIFNRFETGFIDMTGLNNNFFQYYDLVLKHQSNPKSYSKPFLNFMNPKEFFDYNLLQTHPYYFPEWQKQQKIIKMENLIKNKNYYEYGMTIIEGIEQALQFYQRYIK